MNSSPTTGPIDLSKLEIPPTLDELSQQTLREKLLKEEAKALFAQPYEAAEDSKHVTQPDTGNPKALKANNVICPQQTVYTFDPVPGIRDLVDVWHIMYPNTRLYQWQYEELLRMSGFRDGSRNSPQQHWTPADPFEPAYCCANSSGKDMVLIATAAVGLPLLYRNTRVVITSSSHEQLKKQTQAHISKGIAALNLRFGTKVYESIDFYHKCQARGGEITLFATDEPGRAEGWHPLTDDGRLVLIQNEDKSIPEDIQVALLRCHGYSHRIHVSSPGPRRGRFFKSFNLGVKYPALPAPFSTFSRRISYKDCPHIPEPAVQKAIEEEGLHSYFVQTSFFANFFEQETDVAIPIDLLLQCDNLDFRPDPSDLGIGIDSAGGGDETAVYVREGPLPVRSLFFREKNTAKAVFKIHEFILPFQNRPHSLIMDDGGISRAFTDGLQRLGWFPKRIHNQAKANNPARFMNLGAEMLWHVRRLLERRQIKPPEDEQTRTQLTTREYDETKNLGRIELSSKKEMKAAGIPSPDRADAFVLAFWSYRPSKFHEPATFKDPDPATAHLLPWDDLIARCHADPTFLESLAARNRPTRSPFSAYTMFTTRPQ